MITILDYGAGNLRSVENTLGAIGAEYEVVRDAGGVAAARKLILPGVGHFGQMMRSLERMEVRKALLARLRAGLPFLGICLGLQALFERSDEAPEQAGLGLFPGAIRRFTGDVRVPHMGWNEVEARPDSKLLAGIAADPYLYFAHSYYAPVGPYTAATCSYTVAYTAVLEAGTLYGVQFHPEKSGPLGLRIVRNFVEHC